METVKQGEGGASHSFLTRHISSETVYYPLCVCVCVWVCVGVGVWVGGYGVLVYTENCGISHPNPLRIHL